MKSRVRWIFCSLLACIIFISGCSIIEPGVRDPDSPGGKEITPAEQEKIDRDVKKVSEGIGGVLSIFGLPVIGTGAAAAGSLYYNVRQYLRGKKSDQAAKKYSAALDRLKEKADDELRELITEALDEVGATEGAPKEFYHELKKRGILQEIKDSV